MKKEEAKWYEKASGKKQHKAEIKRRNSNRIDIER